MNKSAESSVKTGFKELKASVESKELRGDERFKVTTTVSTDSHSRRGNSHTRWI